MRQKIAANIESSVRRSADLKSALPAGAEGVLALRKVQFADGGSGRLWLTIDGELHLSAEQFQGLTREMISHR
jgi:hypothetical protein